MHEALVTSREVLIQEFIKGKEITCGVLDSGLPQSEFALLPTEIVPVLGNFFDYKSKYESGGADEITPARLHGYQLKQIQKTALLTHRLVGCRGFSRTDMVLTPKGELYVLELNTIPGLTKESLLPKAAVASGISFPQLVDKVVNSAFFKPSL
jgi:D-alanine-D-alanine ligase